jgi:hypothetical protein
LNVAIRSSNKKLFRRMSIVVQLVISIGFAFCSVVILKQMYYLHNTSDLGFKFKNCATLIMGGDREMLENKIRQIPEITETLRNYNPLLPARGGHKPHLTADDWVDKPANAKPVTIEYNLVPREYFTFYEFELVAGEMLSDSDGEPKPLLINESAAEAFGWTKEKAVGQYVFSHRVKGVLKNIYHLSPTVSVHPILYTHYSFIMPEESGNDPVIMFKFRENTWKVCRDKITEIVKAEYPNTAFQIVLAEEEYEKYLKSENTLLWLLSLISLVCMIVCIFGFVSMVSLTCEERRKEIAVRKIHGATVKDILDIFFKEYLTLLVVGAVIAFPVGYFIMKHWLENYVVQTEISVWIYAAILLALIMTIVLCVGGKVYRTSRTNPADSIKS